LIPEHEQKNFALNLEDLLKAIRLDARQIAPIEKPGNSFQNQLELQQRSHPASPFQKDGKGVCEKWLWPESPVAPSVSDQPMG
jgi:hypothetical protein